MEILQSLRIEMDSKILIIFGIHYEIGYIKKNIIIHLFL